MKIKKTLNPNALKWVDYLLSGKYKQGKDALETITDKGESRFCCLGVACDLYRKAGKRLKRKVNEVVYYGPDGCKGSLPEPVREWLGLSTDIGQYGDSEAGLSLAELNDSGKKFPTIAKLILSQPEGLFE